MADKEELISISRLGSEPGFERGGDFSRLRLPAEDAPERYYGLLFKGIVCVISIARSIVIA